MKEVSPCMVRKRTHSYQVKRKHAISDEESPIQPVRIRSVSKAWEEHEIDGASRSSRLGSSRLTNEGLVVQPPIPKQLSHPMPAQRQSDIHRRGYILTLTTLPILPSKQACFNFSCTFDSIPGRDLEPGRHPSSGSVVVVFNCGGPTLSYSISHRLVAALQKKLTHLLTSAASYSSC